MARKFYRDGLEFRGGGCLGFRVYGVEGSGFRVYGVKGMLSKSFKDTPTWVATRWVLP